MSIIEISSYFIRKSVAFRIEQLRIGFMLFSQIYEQSAATRAEYAAFADYGVLVVRKAIEDKTRPMKYGFKHRRLYLLGSIPDAERGAIAKASGMPVLGLKGMGKYGAIVERTTEKG